MKKFLIALLSALMIVTGVAFISACDGCGGEDVLKSYILAESGSLVEDDFVLPSTISGKDVTWESNSEVITIEKRSDDYLAKVNLADEAQTVTLTVKSGKYSNSYEVSVAALDVNYFASKYNFKQEQATVYEDFDLETSTTVRGKTATISWSVEEKYQTYIKVSEDGKKCLVTESALNPQVRIVAEFSYNGHKTTKPYRMTVSFEREHLEEVDYWYMNTGVSITMSGYVVAIGTEYSSQYNNVTLYMVDDDFCAGYYLYRVKTDDENAAKLSVGAHITVTGTTNTNYNGLVETNAGGTLVVDEGKSLTPEVMATKIHGIDNDILTGAPAAIYHTSRLVSLENWTVKEMASSKPEAGASGTLFTLEKGGKTVTVGVSKYLEGVYKTNDSDETYKALVALHDTIKKGDVVSVTGILGNYKGYQILPLNASDVKKSDSAATAAPDYGSKVSSAINKVKDLFPAYMIVSDKTIEVPAVSDGVAIACELLHDSISTTVTGNNVAVKAGLEDIAIIKVTYTVKDGETLLYTTSTFHSVHSQLLNDKQVADKVHFDLELAKVETAADNIEFNKDANVAGLLAQYPSASINWSLKDGQNVTGVAVTDNVLVVTPSTEADRTVIVVATVTSGDVNSDENKDVVWPAKEIEITITKVTPVETGDFNLVLDLTNAANGESKIGKKVYFTGEINNSNYGVTTDDVTKAATVVIKEATNGYTLTVNGKYLELNDKNKMALLDASTGVWKYDYTLKLFTWNGYYLGTYTNTGKGTTADTIGASKISYISGDNASKVGDTQFPVNYVKAAPASLTGTFNLSLYQTNLKKTLYFTGELDGNFGATTEDATKAAEVVVAEANDGYTIKVGEKYLEVQSYDNNGKTSRKVVLVDASTAVWKYDSELRVFTWALDGKNYYLGTYGTFSTISASDVSYISGDKASTVGVSQFPASFVKPGSTTTPPPSTEEPTTPTTPKNPTESTTNPDGSITATVSIADYATSNGWSNGTQYESILADSNVTITAVANKRIENPKEPGTYYATNTGKYYENNNSKDGIKNWRLYQSEEATIEIAAATGYKIVSVKITYEVSNTGTLVEVTSGTAVTVNAAKATYSVGNEDSSKTNGQVRITAIEVVYAAA